MNEISSGMEYEKAIDYILSMIQQGELTVGSKLPTERAIADRLNIGRNSTREALSILHGMGMVDRVHGSGNYISENANGTMRQMLVMMLALGTITKRDICEFRRAMEKATCTLILSKGLKEEHRLQLEKILSDMKKASGKKQAALDKELHLLLIKASENSLLETIMSAVMTVYRDWIDVALSKAGNDAKAKLRECHEGIVSGLVSGEANEVSRFIDAHYDLTEELIM